LLKPEKLKTISWRLAAREEEGLAKKQIKVYKITKP
jgi:hypothetical protein